RLAKMHRSGAVAAECPRSRVRTPREFRSPLLPLLLSQAKKKIPVPVPGFEGSPKPLRRGLRPRSETQHRNECGILYRVAISEGFLPLDGWPSLGCPWVRVTRRPESEPC